MSASEIVNRLVVPPEDAERLVAQAGEVYLWGHYLMDERCFGCGRCIASCPEGAIRLEFQAGRGVPIPSV